MNDELVYHVDDNDDVIGKVRKSLCFEQGLIHRGICIFLFNKDKQLFVTLRKKDRHFFPDRWDGVSGTVKWGETYNEAAHRELLEELNICAEIRFLFDFKYRSPNINSNCRIFEGFSNEKIEINKEELEKGKWVSIQELDNLIKDNPEIFTPSIVLIWKDFKKIRLP